MSRRILVVDDEPHILRLVSYALAANGFEVLEAADGLSAISTALSELPDLILMDVSMPALNGYEACERLQADPRTADIPVVMLSAKSQEAEQEAGFQRGAVGYITKPFAPKDLVRKITSLLGA